MHVRPLSAHSQCEQRGLGQARERDLGRGKSVCPRRKRHLEAGSRTQSKEATPGKATRVEKAHHTYAELPTDWSLRKCGRTGRPTAAKVGYLGGGRPGCGPQAGTVPSLQTRLLWRSERLLLAPQEGPWQLDVGFHPRPRWRLSTADPSAL